MAEYETPDEITEWVRERLAEARTDGVDRHAVPSATRYSPPEAGKVAAALHGPTEDAPPGPPPSTSHAPALCALALTVGLQIAQGVVADPGTLHGLSPAVSGAVLTAAQLVVVLAAIYRMGPTTPPKQPVA